MLRGRHENFQDRFLIFRECAHNAWVKLHRPEVYRALPPSEFDQSLMEAGNAVDVLARDVFPDGMLMARGDAAATAALVADRYPVLYQPVFETDQFTTACDILVWDAAAGRYDLYEVKASSSESENRARDEAYTYDLAFSRTCSGPMAYRSAGTSSCASTAATSAAPISTPARSFISTIARKPSPHSPR